MQQGASINSILRAAALRLACLPRFITIRRYSKKLSFIYKPYVALEFFTRALSCLKTGIFRCAQHNAPAIRVQFVAARVSNNRSLTTMSKQQQDRSTMYPMYQ